MEIFGIGLPEVLLIAVVALIVMGPDRLPEAARTLGKAVYDFRKAIEPARSAWEDVQKQITTGFDVQSAGGSSAGSARSNAAPVASGNPWTVHPIAKGFSEEEMAEFFKSGEIPEWKRIELAEIEANYRNGKGSNGATTGTEELSDVDYPMPHSAVAYQPAPPYAQPLEELDYPEPGSTQEEGKQV